jgi:hypothetical protein
MFFQLIGYAIPGEVQSGSELARLGRRWRADAAEFGS